MTSILTFNSNHGPIHFEVADSIAANAASSPSAGGLRPKGGATPMSADSKNGDVVSGTRFESAMTSLQAYAGSVQEIVSGLAVMPKEVTVEVGLTLKGEAGFFAIAKAGTEAEMRVKLTWEPRAPEDTESDAQA